MGVIYRAWDTLMRREVALKTIYDVASQDALQLFYREWGLQASITHPNVAEIYDIGEMEHDGQVRPYFVMPLLPGFTLGDLIVKSSPRLTIERIAGMVIQICRGLQAAHDRGLIHRDLKPSNIFILEDDSVKIIDFGVAQAGASAQTSVRGTLAYMAPELLEMKPASVASDIFSVGVLSYEALTRRRPFAGSNDAEISRSILREHPPSLADLLPNMPINLGRAIHKAMAKQPWHRYSTAREFGDTVQKALHGEPIAIFDSDKVLPRVEKATKAFEKGEYQVSMEILHELESEGHVEQEITLLRRQVEQAQRQVAVKHLLDSARRFNSEEEFGLALRKVQEALDLDAENTDAQALRNEIEKRRRARKIEEWATLAQKHLDNNAFVHARGALNSLLELRPGEPNALSLMAELERREQEYENVRQEKSRVYSNAREAWERGEVTSALSKLERWMALEKDAPETQGERLLALQSFYDKVRTEHETIAKSLDQAKQLMAQGNYVKALEICRQYLAKYPGHALFQALEFDVEEKQRQHLSAYIADTDNQVERQPDLDKRIAILEEALKVHPGELHFERALKLTQDKRDLVSSVVNRARLHEDEGRFGEAIDQWEILRAIHPSHPGLELEIERLRKRKDAQARQDARANWVKRIDSHIESRAYAKAANDASQALAEFPGDAELEQLCAIAHEKDLRLSEATQFLNRGRALLEDGKFEDAINTLREAELHDEGNPAIRGALTGALAARAKKLAEDQSEKADAALAELMQVDPASTVGMNLRALRADQKREEFITWCTAQARKLQAAGDLNGAIAIVQQGLLTHPNEVRLNQLLGQIEKGAREAASRNERNQALDHLQQLSEDAGNADSLAECGRIAAEVAAVEKGRFSDPESIALIGEIRQKIAKAKAKADLLVPPAPPPPPGPSKQPAAKAAPLRPTPPPPPQQPLAPAPARGASPSAAKTIRPPRTLPKSVRFAIIGGALLIVLLSVFALWKRTQTDTLATVQVEIRTTPPGARIMVGGEQKGLSNLTLDMTPGNYQITAELDGYEPVVTPLTVQSGVPTGVGLILNPWQPSVRVYSDIEITSASLSGRQLNPGAAGEYVLGGLNDGNYDLALTGPQGSARVALLLAGNAMPSVTAPVIADSVDLLLVHLYRDRLVVYCNTPAAQVSVDGGTPIPVPPEGATFPGVAPGTRQVAVSDGKTSRTVPVIVSGGAPVVQAFVLSKADSGRGSLLIATGEDQVSVKINGYTHWLKSRNGTVRIGSLKPGVFKVEVFKDGFESPPPATIEVKPGEEARIELRPRAVVRLAAVSIAGPAGSQLIVDGAAAGVIPPSGSLTLDLPPGQHTFELRRESRRSAPVAKTLRAGEPLSLSSELAFLQPANGSVRFEITPAGAKLTLRRRGEAENQAQPVTQLGMTLAEGAYILTVTAPGHASSVVNFQVAAGSTNTIPVALRALTDQASNRPAAAAQRGVQDFQDIGSWVTDGAWKVRRGGNFVIFGGAPSPGTYEFAFQLRNGKRVQWVTNYKDPRNHVLYRLEGRQLSRVELVNGKRGNASSTDHKLANLDEFDARIVVEQNRIRVELRQGGGWTTVDQFQNPAEDLSAGRFGFLISGNMLGRADEYAVKDFVFRPSGGGQ
jgi:serine/threonine-protein kinase